MELMIDKTSLDSRYKFDAHNNAGVTIPGVPQKYNIFEESCQHIAKRKTLIITED